MTVHLQVKPFIRCPNIHLGRILVDSSLLSLDRPILRGHIISRSA